MASRVDYAVTATPIFSYSVGEGLATDVIATDVGHGVGGSGSVTVTWGATGGYSAGVPIYESSSGNITTTSAKFVYIKHTGFAYGSSSTLGIATTAILTIQEANGSTLAKLPAGGAIILPFAVAQSCNYSFSSSSGTIAIEYFWTA